MAEPKIRRKFKAVPVTLTTSVSTATTVRWDDVAGGSIQIGTVSTSASSFQVWAAGSTAGTYSRVYAADGSAADITLAPSTSVSTIYAMPDAAYGVGAIRIVAGEAAGTATTATVMLKT